MLRDYSLWPLEEDKENNDSDTSHDSVKCQICGKGHPASNLLLCDHPGAPEHGIHTSCLRPPLRRVPRGSWFCPQHDPKKRCAGRQWCGPQAAGPPGHPPEAGPPPGLAAPHSTDQEDTETEPPSPPPEEQDVRRQETPQEGQRPPTPPSPHGAADPRTPTDADTGSDNDEDAWGLTEEKEGNPRGGSSKTLGYNQDESTVWTDAELIAFLRARDTGRPHPRATPRVYKRAKHYFFRDGLLYKKAKPGNDPVRVLTKDQRMTALKEVHDLGHPRADATYTLLRRRYYWDKQKQDAFTYVQECEACQKSSRQLTRIHELHPWPIVGLFDRWHVDIMGPYTTTPRGNTVVAIAVDSWSKYVEAEPLPTKSSEAVAGWFYRQVIARFGCPQTLCTDDERIWSEGDFSKLLREYGIRHDRTSPYHPQGNGQAERMVGFIRQRLMRSLENESDWDVKIYGVLTSIRAEAPMSTGASPALAIYGKEMRLSNRLGEPAATPEEDTGPDTQTLQRRQGALQKVAERVDGKLRQAKERDIRRFNQRHLTNKPVAPRGTQATKVARREPLPTEPEEPPHKAPCLDAHQPAPRQPLGPRKVFQSTGGQAATNTPLSGAPMTAPSKTLPKPQHATPPARTQVPSRPAYLCPYGEADPGPSTSAGLGAGSTPLPSVPKLSPGDPVYRKIEPKSKMDPNRTQGPYYFKAYGASGLYALVEDEKGKELSIPTRLLVS